MKKLKFFFQGYVVFLASLGIVTLLAGIDRLDGAQCDLEKSSYERLLLNLDRACESASECVPADLSWDGCQKPISLNRKAQTRRISIERDELWKKCGYTAPPCALAPITALCVAGKCGDSDDLTKIAPTIAPINFKLAIHHRGIKQVNLFREDATSCSKKSGKIAFLRSFDVTREGMFSINFSELVDIVFPNDESRLSFLKADCAKNHFYFEVGKERLKIPLLEIFAHPSGLILLK